MTWSVVGLTRNNPLKFLGDNYFYRNAISGSKYEQNSAMKKGADHATYRLRFYFEQKLFCLKNYLSKFLIKLNTCIISFKINWNRFFYAVLAMQRTFFNMVFFWSNRHMTLFLVLFWGLRNEVFSVVFTHSKAVT